MGSFRGFTIVELLVTLAMVAIMFAIAMPAYQEYAEKARIDAAKADIAKLNLAIERYRLSNKDAIPPTLATLGVDIPLDPWGQSYRYLVLQGAKTIGDARKDGNLVPLNDDFDLYSIGKDGKTTAPLRAKASQDDVVRANNGAFIGLGKDY